MSWKKCDGEIWDYEKVFHQVKLHDGSLRWVWPNAGKLTDVGFEHTSGREVPLSEVAAYREADDDYFDYYNSLNVEHSNE
jgi:hypothetical protein